MYVVDADIRLLVKQFPYIKKWINNLGEIFFEEKINYDIIDVYYKYSFSGSSEDESSVIELDEDKYNIPYNQRLNIELNKIVVDVTFHINDLLVTKRLPDGSVPIQIEIIVTELTKVKMMMEGQYHSNSFVKKSIPELDTSIVSYKTIDEDGEVLYDSRKNIYEHDLNDILDKISETGVESLSMDEKRFLDEHSKK